jgi:hypothetical protein
MQSGKCFWQAVGVGVWLMGLVGCQGQPQKAPLSPEVLPVVETRADSLALRIYQAWGGPEVWAQLAYIRFDFTVVHEGTPQFRAHHLWHRPTGRYRLEWQKGDSLYVALFNVRTLEGQVYHNGQSLAGPTAQRLLEEAYRRYRNDSFWLLAPVQLFEAGISRFYEADSSTVTYEVLRIELQHAEGLPAARYWFYIDRQTNLVVQWAYAMQDNPRAMPAQYRWSGYRQWETPYGIVRWATQKTFLFGPLVIFTDHVTFPQAVPDSWFTNPMPIWEHSAQKK